LPSLRRSTPPRKLAFDGNQPNQHQRHRRVQRLSQFVPVTDAM
jgi:hypothetical protein